MRTSAMRLTGLVMAFLLTIPALAHAVPPSLNYQGILTDALGNPVITTVDVTFNIYNQATFGAALYTETQTVTPDASGRVNVILSSNALEAAFDGTNRWLGVTVSTDPELSPRVPFTSVPHAFRVGTVDGASGGSISGDVSVGGTVFISGTNGVDGIEFPDGTRQTTAATGLTYTAANTFRYTATGMTDQFLTDFVPAASPPFTARFITGIWIDGQNASADIFAEFTIAGTVVLRLDDHNGTVGSSQPFWMCGGGAPLVLSGGQTLTANIDVNGVSSKNWSLTVTGYDQ